jgi:integrase
MFSLFGLSLRQALDEYYLYLQVDHSANTLKTYSGILEQAAALIGETACIRRISPTDLDKALAGLFRPDHADATRESYKRTVAAFFNWLVKRGHLKQSPVTYAVHAYVRDPIDISKAITEADIARMLDACLNPRDVALVTLFRDTAFRFNGAWHLRLEGVRFAGRAATSLDDKIGKPHTVFMSNALVEALQDWLRERAQRVKKLPVDHGYVFTRLDNGRRLKYWGLYEVMRRLGRRAGVTRSGAHGFRHAWAVWAAANGVSVPETQAQLGHELASTTMNFYYKSPPETLRKVVNRRADGSGRSDPDDGEFMSGCMCVV